MLHGHWVTELVVKLHDFDPLIGVPELFCAPDTVAAYVVPAASGLSGVNVATVSAPLKPTDPLTDPPPEAVTVNDTVLGYHRLRERHRRIGRHRVPRRPIIRRHRRHHRRRGPRRLRVHHIDPVVRRVEAVRGEDVARPVGVHTAAGQRRQRPVRHRRGQPVRGDRIMPRIGVVRGDVGRPRRHRHRGGEVQLLPATGTLTTERPRRQQRPTRRPQAARYAHRCYPAPCRTAPQ